MPGKHKTRPPAEYGQELTGHELRVLRLIAAGLQNKQIGETVYASENTIKTHVQRLAVKLGAHSRAHAVHIGHCLGLLGHPQTPTTEGKS